ncbi:MAG: hypothetical protein APR53_04945 [Methanoculleus sp. SDB]|nr:MAG: hypothetical protein APR53_04945 [Methanoculleus sp. SDB]
MSGEIRNLLSLLFPAGGVVEVRALGEYATHSGYFDDFDALAEKAAFLDRLDEVQGVYVTLNEVNPALLSRRANRIKLKLGRKDATTADADITRRRWLPVDLDPVRPSGVSSSAEEHAAALERADRIADWLSGQGFPEPIRADSGNGAHLLYAIDLPNDDAATALVKACLATIDALFSDPVVTVDTANFNASRIWKLYGTTSKKGDNTPDRPHRTARLLSVPDEMTTVPVERLQHLAGLLTRDEPKPPKKAAGGIDLRGWLRDHGLAVRSERPWQGGTLFVLEECPFSPAHSDGAFAIQFGNGAVFAGCHHASCGGGSQRWPELRDRYEPREKRTKKQQEKSPPPAPDPASTEHREQALAILREGDPLSFLLDTFNREHVGDRIVAECLIMSVASQSVANTKGLHVAISGNSGKGKTHACNAMLALLPEHYRLKGTVSNKALFYHESLRPGTVLLFDDVSLSDDMQELLKSATANFKEPIEHRTLTADRQLRLCTIPPRCVWWLAKVESVGDDQVMNRMLTVWIDDSKEQDRAVLEHMKLAEAQRRGDGQTDTGISVCRAIWEVIKEQILHVRIPFSPRICFLAANNRRNPAMLFDLIKCHALLHAFQRERDEDGSLIADREDFEYARRLFIAISNDAGGQETKQTRNEAAALATIAKMGLEIFTVKQLQHALGLSYHKTYKLLHGYTNSKTAYAGILDKCPAVSLIDATVAEEVCGIELKRREHYFSFDLGIYREWMAKPDVWLEEEEPDDEDNDNPSDDSTLAPGLHPESENQTAGSGACRDEHSCKEVQYREKCTDSKGSLHSIGRTHGMPDQLPGPGTCLCESGGSANEETKRTCTPQVPDPGALRDALRCTREVEAKKTGAKVQTARSPGKVLPLPGLLDHREFERVSTELGRCRICDGARAVYRAEDLQTCICEGCYGRLVREWNAGEGVR